MSRAWIGQNKKEPPIFLKIQSEYRQVISSKFPKSFRGAGALVVLGEFLWFFGGFLDLVVLGDFC